MLQILRIRSEYKAEIIIMHLLFPNRHVSIINSMNNRYTLLLSLACRIEGIHLDLTPLHDLSFASDIRTHMLLTALVIIGHVRLVVVNCMEEKVDWCQSR